MSNDSDIKTFAWAGLQLQIPMSYRLTKIKGNYDNGSLSLADESQVRLQIAWGQSRRRKIFDADTFLRKRLIKATTKLNTDIIHANIKPFYIDAFSPLLCYTDKENKLEHYAGFCKKTKRLVQILYRQGTGRENRLFHSEVLPSLYDQPVEDGLEWNFFSQHFRTPPGFRYHSAMLKIGDMSVTLLKDISSSHQNEITIRCIYPATLALNRKDNTKWIEDIILETDYRYRGRRKKIFSRRTVSEPIDTPIGPALRAITKLRSHYRIFIWRVPPLSYAVKRFNTMRCNWLIHDRLHDRLLYVVIGAKRKELDDIFQQTLVGLK